MADDQNQTETGRKPLEFALMAILGLLTILALLLILTDLQGWI